MGENQHIYKEGGQEAAALSGAALLRRDRVLARYNNFQHDVSRMEAILLWRPPTCI